MNRGRMMTCTAALLAALPPAGFGGGFERLSAEAAAYDAGLTQALGAVKVQASQRKESFGRRPTLPPPPGAKDAFAGLEACRPIDELRFVLRPMLDDVVSMLAPCAEAVSRRYAARVTASRAEVRLTASRPGVEGVGLFVEMPIPLGNSVLRDLEHALARRGGQLFGHPAQVMPWERPEPRPKISSLQGVLDRCAIPALLGPVRTADDFIMTYGHCLKSAPGLWITSLTPARRQEPLKPAIKVWLTSRAPVEQLNAMSGIVYVAGESGRTPVLISAFADIRIHPTRGE